MGQRVISGLQAKAWGTMRPPLRGEDRRLSNSFRSDSTARITAAVRISVVALRPPDADTGAGSSTWREPPAPAVHPRRRQINSRNRIRELEAPATVAVVGCPGHQAEASGDRRSPFSKTSNIRRRTGSPVYVGGPRLRLLKLHLSVAQRPSSSVAAVFRAEGVPTAQGRATRRSRGAVPPANTSCRFEA